MEPKTRRTTIYFQPAIHRQLRLRAAGAGISVSDLVNEIITTAIEPGAASAEYAVSSSEPADVREPGAGYTGLTERIERMERRLGIVDDDPGIGVESEIPLTLADVKERLDSHHQRLKELGVRSLAVFGSLAKQRFRSGSDIDLLVEYEQTVGLFRHIELEQFLTLVLDSEIDLVTPDSLRPKLKNKILDEAIHVFPI